MVILPLEGLRQEYWCKFMASLGSMVSFRPAWATQRDPVSKTKGRKEKSLVLLDHLDFEKYVFLELEGNSDHSRSI